MDKAKEFRLRIRRLLSQRKGNKDKDQQAFYHRLSGDSRRPEHLAKLQRYLHMKRQQRKREE